MHKLLVDDPGARVLLLGNEAIARGAMEAGVAFATTYPGTPSSEISLNLFQISGRAISISNTAPTKKWPWKWPPERPMPGCAPCA
jgi:TPP-dependent indolepyruvate ferredoxin oxidoreductase alpha subunit